MDNKEVDKEYENLNKKFLNLKRFSLVSWK